MISFRDREDFAAGVIAILSMIVLVATFGFFVFVKPPTTLSIAARTNKTLKDLQRSTDAENAAAIKDQIPVNSLTWTDDAETIGTKALDTANEIAAKRGVKLTVFRWQSPKFVDNLVSLPYSVTVEGTYLGVLNFTRDMEDPKNKIAVTQIQMSSSDPNTDKVTANIGIVAYVNPKEEMPLDASSTLQSRLHPKSNRLAEIPRRLGMTIAVIGDACDHPAHAKPADGFRTLRISSVKHNA